MTSTDAQRDAYAQSLADGQADTFSYTRDVILPVLLPVIGSVEQLTVLDAGCGEGIISRLLAPSAQRMVGIDIAERLIAYARERDSSGRITYLVHDLSQPLPEYTATFDLIVSNLVLNDVANYQGFSVTLAALLKPGGRVVLSHNNPYSALLREKVSDYFDTTASTRYGFGDVTYYHRTMEDYVRSFSQAGLLLRGLYDVRMTEEQVARLPRKNRSFPWFSYYHRYPFIQILDWVKLTAGLQGYHA